MNGQIFYCVSQPNTNIKVFTMAYNREGAKRQAHRWIGLDPDKYTVSPLTNKGDRVKLDVILSI